MKKKDLDLQESLIRFSKFLQENDSKRARAEKKAAAERLRERLAQVEISVPRIPVIHNIDAASHTDPQALREALYRQASGPVRWVDVVRALRARGLGHVLECGPGKVLSGLVKRIDPELASLTVLDPASLAQAREMLA